MRIKINHELRLKAFDLLEELKNKNIGRKEIIDKLQVESRIDRGTLLQWYAGQYRPWGRKGDLTYRLELFYVLGALLGDGCLYKWKITDNYIILVGDRNFTEKYAERVSLCTGKRDKAYIDRSKNIWFVKSNNYNLYELFKKVRGDVNHLESLLNKRQEALFFIEGFFDAEGCVKIIKEPVRKTPKICLDITNTNFAFLEVVKKLLKSNLNIEAKYSIQKPDGLKNKQIAYHLRIYKKEYVKIFFDNIKTTKLKEEKILYVKNWLNNGK